MSKHIKADIVGGTMEIVIARPEKKNALTSAMYRLMIEAIARAESDASVHAILFAAEGDMFSAGNDMEDFVRVSSGAQELGAVQFMEAIALAQKPVVAAVHGHAIGIGTTMLLHCDLVYIAEEARLSAPFIRLGIVPEAASSLLMPARIGHTKAFAMFALGEAVSGKEAVALGLANAALPAGEVATAARKACAALAFVPPGALIAAKNLMRDREQLLARIRKEAAVLAERVRSPEAAEAFSAFIERRQPNFAKLRAAAVA
jgi:enoyl-CoA hydratase/carnithine racemase